MIQVKSLQLNYHKGNQGKIKLNYFKTLETLKNIANFHNIVPTSEFSLIVDIFGGHSIFNFKKKTAQPAITCSKLTIETLEQGVKYVQS